MSCLKIIAVFAITASKAEPKTGDKRLEHKEYMVLKPKLELFSPNEEFEEHVELLFCRYLTYVSF